MSNSRSDSNSKTLDHLAQQKEHFQNLDFSKRTYSDGVRMASSDPELTLISATPSPFARMNRIALHEKGIPFKLQNEIPWESATQTPKYNPLEKLPILLFSDGRDPVYDSAHIQDYIVRKYADKAPKLLPDDLDDDLKARQILILSEGLMDAYVLRAWEERRGDKKSSDWLARQDRKIDGAFRAFEDLAKNRQTGSEYVLDDALTIADIAIVCAVGQIEFGKVRPKWQEDYPELSKYWSNLNSRPSFKETEPVMFDLKENVV